MDIKVPLTVPRSARKEYIKNYNRATNGTGRLMMFAGDQKVEHLNDDFIGANVPLESANPEHYFQIASEAHIGVFATQLGLMARYGMDYPDIPYMVKMNSKTNLIKKNFKDPLSSSWVDLDDVLEFKKQSGLNILGVGYTIYMGSWYESEMFKQAAQLIYDAHQHGLITVIWMYPRGKVVDNEKDVHLIAGGAGVALCLGSDFVKVNYPYAKDNKKVAKEFKEVTTAAGRCGVICIGGSKQTPKAFLNNIYQQMHISGTRGNAVGRNIYQQGLQESIRMANAISSIILYDKTPNEAYAIYQGKKKLEIW